METSNPSLAQLGLQDEEAKKKRTPKPKPFRMEPAAMLANPAEHAHGDDAGFWYWIGITSNAPFSFALLNGVQFSKVTENVMQEGNETRRFPRIGDVFFLTVSLAERMLRRLPLVVVRRYPNQDVETDAGRVKNAGNPYRSSTKGHLITITGQAEAAELRAKNIPIPRYDYDPTDEPVSRYLFAQLCPDQEKPMAGMWYPPSLEEQAFEYPLHLNVGEPR